MDVTETTSYNGRGVGSRLKQAREAKGLTVDTVSTELCILKRHIEAIERDDFDSLPQMAFTRGFILSYAKYLKLNSEGILQDFEDMYPKNQVDNDKPLTESIQTQQIARVSRDRKAQKTNFGRYSLLFALLGLLGLGAFYLHSKQPFFGENTSETVTEKVSTLDSMRQEDGLTEGSQTDNTQADSQTQSTTDVNNATESGTTTSTVVETAESETQATTTEPTPVVVDPNAAPAEIVFWVRKNTEITITDQTGQVVMSGTKSRGEHKASGKPPFTVNISVAKNVELNLDQVPQKKLLRQSTQADGSAKFTLTK